MSSEQRNADLKAHMDENIMAMQKMEIEMQNVGSNELKTSYLFLNWALYTI